MELQPGDMIVLEFPGVLRRDHFDEIRRQASDAFGVDETRIVVVSNCKVSVLREGQPPPPPVVLSPGTL
jgi:hypothetical protein